jgi:two-component system aerobic respiration control sensor histidine kinase ArcB
MSKECNANTSIAEDIKDYLENIIALLPGHIFWKDLNCRFLGCNDLQATIVGLHSRQDIVGKSAYDIISKNQPEEMRSAQAEAIDRVDRKIMRTGIPLTIEEPLALDDGRTKTFLSHKIPLKDKQKNIVGLLGVAIDISERKEMEEKLHQSKIAAEKANHVKTEFLENMRHDIRTPLSGIIGFTDLLKSASTEPHVKEYAENLVASSYALLDLLDDVLEAIRVSSSDIPKVKKKFSLEKILQNVIDLNRAKALQKNLNLLFKWDSKIPRYVVGDNIRIHRIVLELVANALNFTDHGSVELSIELAKQNYHELVLKIRVEDTGIGIPKEKQQDIYLQFTRLTPSYKGIYKGAGLGLFIIRQFIDELNGEIHVKSVLGKGSVFTCIIPIREALIDDDDGVFSDTCDNDFDEITYTQPIPILSSPKNNDNAYNILVVEDNIIAQIVTRSILEKFNCTVDIAKDSQSAIDLWKKNHYDLIFMDIGLPDMDGDEVTYHIRNQEVTKGAHVPIIALTAHIGEENKKRCIEAGMNAVLTKPLTEKSCLDVINAFITEHPKEDETHYLSYQNDLPSQETELFDLESFPLLKIDNSLLVDKTTLHELLVYMVDKSLTDDVTFMKEAYHKKDWDSVQKLAHKIKGGAVYVGTGKLKMACQYLERYWKTGKRDLLEPLYQQLLVVIDDSEKTIKAWLT